MVPKSVMDNKIKQKQVEVLKVNERIANGVYIKTVLYNNSEYKLCSECKHYLLKQSFTKNQNACKSCRNKKEKERRDSNFRAKIYPRWRRMIHEIDTEYCSFEEFYEFAKTQMCIFTNRTLEDDFINPSPNKLLRLEVDHIIPKSKNGNSKIENLQVVPYFWNRLKSSASAQDCDEVIGLLRENVL